MVDHKSIVYSCSVEHYKLKPNKNKVVWICLAAWIICFCIGKLL
jgi:hypothetical protein